MHICLNLSASASWMGGVIYIQNIARAINSLPAEETQDIKLSVTVSRSNISLVKPISNCLDKIYVNESFYLKSLKNLAEYFPLIPVKLFNPYKIDFLYPTVCGNNSPFAWGGWIPDFQAYYFPEFFTPKLIESCKQWHKVVSQSASVAVFSSEVARKDFRNFYPESKVPTEVLHFATSPEENWFHLNPIEVQQKYSLSDHFFLVCNQFCKHKDHTVIIEALDFLRKRGHKLMVVCTGKTEDPRDSAFFGQLVRKIKSLGLQEQFVILGLIPRIDQIQLMRRCLAVIQPSRFEGWSTVVEDARTMGKPVILSDIPVHLEQNPPYSYFFSQGNSQDLANIIQQATDALKPGPDPEAERKAKEENLARLQQFGRRFLEIALTANQS